MGDQEKINRNVNELSQKLLEGCKLLSDSCPETNVPLVSTKDGRMYSVGNGAYYIRDAGELRKLGSAEPSSAGLAPAEAGATPSGASPVPGVNGASPWSGAPALPSPPPVRDAENDSQSLSARVAQKLLEGYTLLSESCPQTSVPLVQNTSGQIYSVGTGKFYARVGAELRELPTPHDAAVGSMAPPPPPPMGNAQPSPSSLGLAPSFASAAEVAPPPISFGPPKTMANGDAPTSPAPWTHPPSVPAADVHTSTPLAAIHPVVESTLSVLYQKLEQARLELLRSQTTEAAAPLVALVKDIAQAISALKTA